MQYPKGEPVTIVWFRDDLRLADNAALTDAVAAGRVVPLYIRETRASRREPGGARRWWLHHSLDSLARSLRAAGAPLCLASGDPFLVLVDYARRCGARRIVWNRRYEPACSQADAELKRRLVDEGFEVGSFPGWLLHEPTRMRSRAGGHYRVFTPFWRAFLAEAEIGAPLPAPRRIAPCATTLPTESLEDWNLLPTAPDWAGGLREAWRPGEAGARLRLETFVTAVADGYADGRNFPGTASTSRLSPHLAHGEITPRQVLAAIEAPQAAGTARDRDVFRAEIGWREFSWHLLVNEPFIAWRNHDARFDAFPWSGDEAGFERWTSGRTGYPIVDAGMRQLWQTGWMHNRVRMIAASFLTKHLLVDWRRGEAWFRDTLVDADPASNAAGWQWVAGSGADAAPYFRIFNPVLQGEKFDPDGAYVRAFLPEIARLPDRYIHRPFEAPPDVLSAAGIVPGHTYPHPVIDHRKARDRALAAYAAIREAA